MENGNMNEIGRYSYSNGKTSIKEWKDGKGISTLPYRAI
jgi:hypothetical protein